MIFYFDLSLHPSSLSLSLSKAQIQATKLEEQINELVKDKNKVVHDLEGELQASKKELELNQTELTSSRELVQVLRRELTLYQTLVEDLRRASKDAGGATEDVAGERGETSLEETVERLLVELDNSMHTLTDQLHSSETSFSFTATTGAEQRERGGDNHTHRKSTKNSSTYICHSSSSGPYLKPAGQTLYSE